ncbi:hypothetical protein [Streptomyces rubiginosohelvolus]|uniref:Integral membrane protein n=1 Tax=Streptomyces rubiginosohelvolus TaxID=67362 RepID=A0ABQ3CC48_9ACTN|nr:hypothetical protein [Streptomyces pluricolorescens]GGZ83493.1 hypothetical protein GCM10010328_67230 [Streptomyces pluricolorescens]
MSASDAKTSRRMPWRLAILTPPAVYIVIWRGVPGITPMLTFTWITGLLVGGGLIVAGMYGPQALAGMARANKEARAMRRLKAQQKAHKNAVLGLGGVLKK